ncbi:MAG: alcohol dehydrogenase catalytic domain-containing protein [Deltaproteobacteria bacterium]|nr:alcohol dehydrogenase catalytic domain-containing protein [Deltaproteobacteria bacterium]
MRAIVFDKTLIYAKDYPTPMPGDGEALIKVVMAGICATDLEIIKGYMGFKGVLGHEFCGMVVEAADSALTGRRVAGEINIGCGRCKLCASGARNHCPERSVLGILNKDGVFADYVTMPVENLHPLPGSITDEEAVFIEPLAAAFEIGEQVELEGKDVCVLGDGRLGLLCAQAIALSDCNLTVIGRHAEKLAILERRGIRAKIGASGMGRIFDVVVDCTGSASGFAEALALARPRGTVVLKTTVAERTDMNLNQLVIDEITVTGSRCGPFKSAIVALAGRRVDVLPLVSRIFSMEDGIAALGHAGKKGVMKVLVRVG